jgi:hypothetical protein
VPGAATYSLYTGCPAGLCRSADGGLTWEQVPGAPGPTSGSSFNTALVANSDGQRARLYVGTAGGIASPVGQRAPAQEVIPGLGGLLGGGVYRYTLTPGQAQRVYLPLIFKNYGP